MTPLARKISKPKSAPPAVDLKLAVARLRESTVALIAERNSMPQSRDARLDTILREIHETVLPRQIILHGENSIVAQLTASNRRLCAVDLAGQKDTIAASSFTFAKNLHAASEHVTRISTVPIAGGGSTGTQTHFSVSQLQKALTDQKQPARMEALKAHLTRNAVAYLTWQSGAETVSDGAATWQLFLEQQVENILPLLMPDQPTTHQNTQSPKGCAIPLSSESILVIACTAQEGVAVVTDHRLGLESIERWQANEPADHQV